MTASSAPNVTTADAFLAWDDRQQGSRHELLDGRVFARGAERAIHARTKYAVTRCFERAVAEAGLPCEALVDGMAVRVDEATVFEPDALVRCEPPLPDDALVVVDRSSSSRWTRPPPSAWMPC